MRNLYKKSRTGQKCINLSETHFKEIILELENAAEIILNQKNEIDSLEGALNTTKDELDILQENNRLIKREKKKLMIENQKTLSTLNNEIETLKMELQHSQNQVEVWKGRTNESKASLRKFLESTIMDSGNDSINNCTYIENYENTIVNLKNQLDERQLKIEQLEMNIQSIDIERTEISNELVSLKNKSKANEYELRELREKQRKEENERKRYIMREEKLSQEIDSLCKKYNAEIDLLQKRNIELNEEIWELNRIIKNNKSNIKELQDQNIINKKYQDYYFSIKEIENIISDKINDFQLSVQKQFFTLNEIIEKLEKNKIFKKNDDFEKNNFNKTSNFELSNKFKSIPTQYISNDENININTINSGVTTVNTCSSSNINSNAPAIVQPSIEVNFDDEVCIQNDIVTPNCTGLIKEVMRVLNKTSYDHENITERIRYLSKKVDELEEKNKDENKNENENKDEHRQDLIYQENTKYCLNKDDDNCSESSIISFLSEL